MKTFALLLLILLFAAEASAAGIGAAPAELNFNVEKGKVQQRELTIYNLADKETNFEIATDSDFLRFHGSNSVDANGRQKIIVEADAKKLKEGSYTGTVYVTASSGASGVRLSTGTAIKTSVAVFELRKASVAVGIMVSTIIVVAGLLAYAVAERLRLSTIQKT